MLESYPMNFENQMQKEKTCLNMIFKHHGCSGERRDAMSIKRIAELAGVSIATVSNALNGTGRISESTAARIRELAESEGLALRPRRRPGREGRKHITFTLAESTMSSLRYSNFNMRIFEGVQSSLESAGCPVVLFSRVDARNIERHTRDSAGVILMGHAPGPQALVDAAGKPLVWVSRYETGTADSVLENNREVARIGAEYLLGRGHRIIGYIDDQYIGTVSDRGRYFADFLRDAGAKAVIAGDRPIFNLMGDHPIVNADKLDGLLTKMFSGKDRPTALFSPGDLMSVSIYAFLKRHGMRPMKDIDFISCNNEMPFMRDLSPRPPTIDFNLFAMGRRAAEMLLWRMKNPEEPPQKMLIQPYLVMPKPSA